MNTRMGLNTITTCKKYFKMQNKIATILQTDEEIYSSLTTGVRVTEPMWKKNVCSKGKVKTPISNMICHFTFSCSKFTKTFDSQWNIVSLRYFAYFTMLCFQWNLQRYSFISKMILFLWHDIAATVAGKPKKIMALACSYTWYAKSKFGGSFGICGGCSGMVMPSVSRSRNLISMLSSISRSVLVNSLVIWKIDQTLEKQTNLRFIYTQQIFFFDLCRCSFGTLNYILYELIRKRCRFSLRPNITEPFCGATDTPVLDFW